jgi:hypothetical protein
MRGRDLLIRTAPALVLVSAAWALSLFGRYAFSIGSIRRHHVESAVFVLTALCIVRLSLVPRSTGGPPRVYEPWHWIAAGVATVAVLLYLPTLSIGFLSDDFVLAEWARHGDFVGPAHAFVRPVPLVLWSVLLRAGGGPGSIHAMNLLLHAANGALVVVLCRSFGLNAIHSALAGLLFVVWPTQVEAVAWVSAMSDVLVTTLALIVVILYVRMSAPRAGRLMLLIAVTALALFTKESALTIAPLLAAVAICRGHGRLARSELSVLATAFVMCGAFLVWRVWIRTPYADEIRPALTRYVFKEQISRTFGGLAVPLPANASPWLILVFGTVAIVLPACAVLLARRREPAHAVMCMGAFWALIAAVPALGYLFVGNELEGSRYLYLSTVGWAVLFTAGSTAAAAGRIPMRVVCSSAIALSAVLSVQQSRELILNWRAAGIERDVILLRARTAGSERGCDRVRATGLPAVYHGAQLFRNGFEDAYAAALAPGTRTCDLHWDGHEFR